MPKYTQTQIDDAMTILSICASASAPGHDGNVLWIFDAAEALGLEPSTNIHCPIQLTNDAFRAYARLDSCCDMHEAYAGAQALLGSGWLPDTE